MADLKPCPFCGSEELDIWQNDCGNHFVVCIGCGASGRDERKVEKAVEVWNRRYEDAICFCRDCHWYDDGEHKGECRLHKIKVKKNGYCFEAWRK